MYYIYGISGSSLFIESTDYDYREVGTPLIQHVCAILAFGSGTAMVPQTLHEFKFEYSCKCKSIDS